MASPKKVLLLLSGGVDSFVSAVLLQQQGYEVIGLHFDLFKNKKENQTSRLDFIKEKLNIPIFIEDLKADFQTNVIDYFLDEYSKITSTPNPCVNCNKTIKFGLGLKFLEKYWADFLATGHYANIIQKENKFYLTKGIDPLKDQSYFLYNLKEEELKKIIFPLGSKDKKEIFTIAAANDYELKTYKESQNACFLEWTKAKNFLNEKLGFKPGDVLNEQGEVIGRHFGLHNYTFAQRRGLNLFNGQPGPRFVKDFIVDKNQLIVCLFEDLPRITEFRVLQPNLINFPLKDFRQKLSIKTRFSQKEVLGDVWEENNILKVKLETGLTAIAPGQSAVFYNGEICVGGGVISF